MTQMRYAEPTEMTEAEIEDALASMNPPQIITAILSAVLYGADPDKTEDILVRFGNHPDKLIRGTVASCIGHFARLHRMLGRGPLEALLFQLLQDPDADVAGRADTALDDVEVFLRWTPVQRQTFQNTGVGLSEIREE